MTPPKNRRLLLSEDDEHSVWLDLETGQEVVTPRGLTHDLQATTLETAIAAWFEDMGIEPIRAGTKYLLAEFSLTLFAGAALLWFNEEDRSLSCSVDLGLTVPKARRTDVANALLNVQGFVESRVLNFGGCLYVKQFVRLGDATLTAGFIRAQFEMVTDEAQVLHLVFANVIAGLCKPTDALILARQIRQTLASAEHRSIKGSSINNAEDTT